MDIIGASFVPTMKSRLVSSEGVVAPIEGLEVPTATNNCTEE